MINVHNPEQEYCTNVPSSLLRKAYINIIQANKGEHSGSIYGAVTSQTEATHKYNCPIPNINDKII